MNCKTSSFPVFPGSPACSPADYLQFCQEMVFSEHGIYVNPHQGNYKSIILSQFSRVCGTARWRHRYTCAFYRAGFQSLLDRPSFRTWDRVWITMKVLWSRRTPLFSWIITRQASSETPGSLPASKPPIPALPLLPRQTLFSQTGFYLFWNIILTTHLWLLRICPTSETAQWQEARPEDVHKHRVPNKQPLTKRTSNWTPIRVLSNPALV